MQWVGLYRPPCLRILNVLSVPWPGDGFPLLAGAPVPAAYARPRAPGACPLERWRSAGAPTRPAVVSPPGRLSE